MSVNVNKPTRVAFISLGCAKNLVDSEKMLGRLARDGCELTTDPDQADAIVINTCGFLEASRTEAHEVIAEAVGHKETGCCKRIVVAGCLVQRDGEQLLRDVPGIDALVGVNNRDDVVRAVMGQKDRDQVDLYLGDYYWRQDDDTARLRLTPQHYAYLRMSEGCNQKCTFCTIPSIRGAMHCKNVEQILAEARELVADGAVEINLIGQDTTSYGADFGYQPGLAGLLRELDALDGLKWIRLLYAYPAELTDEMLRAIAECEKVCNYIDMPLQHVNDRLLKAMHRRVTKRETIELLERVRQIIPGVSIRTTMIAGFPGETDAEFEELLEFVEDFRFDALGVFPYSAEPDTPAGRMKHQIPGVVKQQRADEIMSLQQEVAFELAEARVGQTFEVLIDGEIADQRQPAGRRQPARHAGQAPEVDSLTYVSGRRFEPGEVVTVRCSAACDYDLIAQPTGVILPVLS